MVNKKYISGVTHEKIYYHFNYLGLFIYCWNSPGRHRCSKGLYLHCRILNSLSFCYGCCGKFWKEKPL